MRALGVGMMRRKLFYFSLTTSCEPWVLEWCEGSWQDQGQTQFFVLHSNKMEAYTSTLCLLTHSLITHSCLVGLNCPTNNELWFFCAYIYCTVNPEKCLTPILIFLVLNANLLLICLLSGSCQCYWNRRRQNLHNQVNTGLALFSQPGHNGFLKLQMK